MQVATLADRVLAERRELAATTTAVSPPPHICKKVGERPADPVKRKEWDGGVSQIEGYRQRHGVKDQSRALGPKAERAAQRARQEAARRRLERVQRALGRGRQLARTRDIGRSLGIGR